MKQPQEEKPEAVLLCAEADTIIIERSESSVSMDVIIKVSGTFRIRTGQEGGVYDRENRRIVPGIYSGAH